MIKLGITGGMGSGKSVVCQIFRLHGIPVFDADAEAKKLNDTSPAIREQLSRYFGKEIYADGKLNRRMFAEMIFGDEENLRIANSIIHPQVAKEYLKWTHENSRHAITILESAILFEAGFRRFTDKTIAVYAPKEVRIGRSLARDNASRQDIEARMDKQMPEEEKMRLANFTIYNDNVQPLLPQIARILRQMQDCAQ